MIPRLLDGALFQGSPYLYSQNVTGMVILRLDFTVPKSQMETPDFLIADVSVRQYHLKNAMI